jgi:hypothetical protein
MFRTFSLHGPLQKTLEQSSTALINMIKVNSGRFDALLNEATRIESMSLEESNIDHFARRFEIDIETSTAIISLLGNLFVLVYESHYFDELELSRIPDKSINKYSKYVIKQHCVKSYNNNKDKIDPIDVSYVVNKIPEDIVSSVARAAIEYGTRVQEAINNHAAHTPKSREPLKSQKHELVSRRHIDAQHINTYAFHGLKLSDSAIDVIQESMELRYSENPSQVKTRGHKFDVIEQRELVNEVFFDLFRLILSNYSKRMLYNDKVAPKRRFYPVILDGIIIDDVKSVLREQMLFDDRPEQEDILINSVSKVLLKPEARVALSGEWGRFMANDKGEIFMEVVVEKARLYDHSAISLSFE